MPRYQPLGRMDDQILTDGDRGFSGIDSYLEPTTLEGGTVETSENMRLDGDLASVRKGIYFKSGAFTLTYAGDEQVLSFTLFIDPATFADRKSRLLNSSHPVRSRMPLSA